MKRFLTIFFTVCLMTALAVPAMAGGVYRYPPGYGHSIYHGVQRAPAPGHSYVRRGYHRGGHYGGYYGGTNRHSWEPVAVLAGAVVATKIIDGIFSSKKEVVVVQSAPTPIPNSSAYQRGYNVERERMAREREAQEYERGRQAARMGY